MRNKIILVICAGLLVIVSLTSYATATTTSNENKLLKQQLAVANEKLTNYEKRVYELENGIVYDTTDPTAGGVAGEIYNEVKEGTDNFIRDFDEKTGIIESSKNLWEKFKNKADEVLNNAKE